MQAYSITYEVNGVQRDALIDAKDGKSAMNKIKNKLVKKDGLKARAIKFHTVRVIGYY